MRIKMFYSILIFLTFIGYESYAQVYRTSWDNTMERQGWSQYHLGLDSNASWYYTPVAVLTGEVLVHAAPSLSSSNFTDNWIVSPMFNFSTGGSIDSLVLNLSGAGLPTMFDTLGIYLISGSHDPALSSSKQLLKQFDSTDYMQNGGTYQNTPAINIPATPGNSYLAFRYKTVNSQFDALFDALQVTANFNTATSDIQRLEDNLKIYPNPGRGLFKIELAESMGTIDDLIVFNAIGSKIHGPFSNKVIDLSSLSQGIYFIQVKTSRAGVFVKEIIIK